MATVGAPKVPPASRWLVALGLLLTFVWLLTSTTRAFGPTRVAYSEFRDAVDAGRVVDVTLTPTLVSGRMRRDGPAEVLFEAQRVEDATLLADLRAHGAKVSGAADPSSMRETLFWLVAMFALPVALLVFARRSMGPGRGAGGLFAVGQSKAKVYVEDAVKVSFADVAGVDEARDELVEVVEFLRTPEHFRRLGGRIPKGVLLVGPPGTGKTLLARAVAGEAKVPFFSISGSEFVEMFVGVGAARVRDLFEQAKAKAPCIVFIDEIDALGKVRGVGPMAHEEREQTLQQLLVELDGFDARTGVILMAATNRPEILDPALLRAGRFDRHVLVDRPDRAGRIAILRVHMRGVTAGDDVDVERIATMTAGLVGADLANLVNEAALLAARRERAAVGAADFEDAVERITAGLAKKSRVLSARERERVAFHEVGHALVAQAIPGADPVQKVSIIPRGIAALGYTLQLPSEDRFLRTETELRDKIAVLLGGWVAERLVFGEVSTGASDDLAKATDVAHAMVASYGMAPGLGPLSIDRGGRSPFLDPGASGGEHALYGERAAEAVETEVRRILDAASSRARELLRAREPALREAAKRLLERETITGDELLALGADLPAAVPSPDDAR